MEKERPEMWYDKNATFKENKVVVKLYENDGSFKKSIIIPTMYYPLNKNYEVFHYNNTEQMQDENILKIFDSIKYSIGHCYSNTKALVHALKNNGYNVKSYAGWLFTGADEIPIHHCWAVLDGKYVLDLSDDYTQMLYGENAKNWENVDDAEEQRLLIASFAKVAKEWQNRIRCYPVGRPTPFLLYVGCECEADNGRVIYQRLMKQFPDHECERNCDSSGLNATQRILKKAGLME